MDDPYVVREVTFNDYTNGYYEPEDGETIANIETLYFWSDGVVTWREYRI